MPARRTDAGGARQSVARGRIARRRIARGGIARGVPPSSSRRGGGSGSTRPGSSRNDGLARNDDGIGDELRRDGRDDTGSTSASSWRLSGWTSNAAAVVVQPLAEAVPLTQERLYAHIETLQQQRSNSPRLAGGVGNLSETGSGTSSKLRHVENTCPTCRYELPYEEEPELTIEVEDEENEAQRLADGEVAATAAAREAAASLVELAAYDAMTHAEEATPPRVRTARAAAAAAALREVAAEPPLQPSFSQQRASLRRRATAETADIVREANAVTVGNHLDTIRSLQREAEAAPSPEAIPGISLVGSLIVLVTKDAVMPEVSHESLGVSLHVAIVCERPEKSLAGLDAFKRASCLGCYL